MPKVPPQPAAPKLVNRGPAGLLSKKPDMPTAELGGPRPLCGADLWASAPKDRIAKDLESLAYSIDSFQLDPNNARLHPERNMASIKDSLCLYGQKKPIVVRAGTMTVVAGNGTLEAARELGWTKIAASVDEMTDVEAAGYGLADNRTAELAKWDFEVVARLDRLLNEANHASIGWSQDELDVLRAADWTPPPIEEGGFGTGGADEAEPLIVSFTPDQYVKVGEAINLQRLLCASQDSTKMDQAEALENICKEWFDSYSELTNGQTEKG